MLIDANCVKDVMEQLRPDDFYLKQNREIFETIYSMFVYSKPIDGVTVAGEMEKNGTYEESTTRPYLAQLMDVTPTSANVMEYVGIVRDKALLRALYTVAGEISTMVQDGTGGASSVLDAAEQKIYAVRRGRSAQSMASIGVVLQGVLDHLSELSANGGKTLPAVRWSAKRAAFRSTCSWRASTAVPSRSARASPTTRSIWSSSSATPPTRSITTA